MKLRDAQDHRKTIRCMAEFRAMTSAEARKLFSSTPFRTRNGTVAECRVSGNLKTWKRDPNRFRLPVKYGFYQSSAIVECSTGPKVLRI